MTLSLLRDESTHLSLDLPFMNSPSRHWLDRLVPVGSSSGLVCLKIKVLLWGRYIVVWNPATRQFRFLPHSGLFLHPLLGFEFFQETRDYKVVSILKRGPDNRVVRAKVFTSSTNAWREVKSHYCCSSGETISLNDCSITLNGVLYSPLTIEEQTSQVCSFNLRDEVFNVMQLPESSTSISGQIDLVSWRNSLAFLTGPINRPPSELWVMTEERSAGTTQITWVKQFIIQPPILQWPRFISSGSCKDEYLLGDKILDAELYRYSPASQKSTRLPTHEQTNYYSYYRAFNYVESLVSVK